MTWIIYSFRSLAVIKISVDGLMTRTSSSHFGPNGSTDEIAKKLQFNNKERKSLNRIPESFRFVGPDNWNDHGIRDRRITIFAKHFCLAGTRIEINQLPRY